MIDLLRENVNVYILDGANISEELKSMKLRLESLKDFCSSIESDLDVLKNYIRANEDLFKKIKQQKRKV